jgi:hypothetical protein
VVRKGFAHGLAARERMHRGIRFGYGLFGRQRVFGCRGFQFFKL